MGNETGKPTDFHPEFENHFQDSNSLPPNTLGYPNFNFDETFETNANINNVININDLNDLPPISFITPKNQSKNDSESDTDDDGNEFSISKSESKMSEWNTGNMNTTETSTSNKNINIIKKKNKKKIKKKKQKSNNIVIIQNHTVNYSQNINGLTPQQLMILQQQKNYQIEQKKQKQEMNNVFKGEPMNVCWVFWKDNVDILPRNRQKELALLLYSHMFQKMPNARRLFIRGDIEKTALRFLDMFGFLIRQIKHPNQGGLVKTLQGLGKRHTGWGVQSTYFEPMLNSLHASLSDHFTHTYTVRVKFSMEQLFTCAANVMTGKDLRSIFSQRYSNIKKLDFLDSLELCLSDETGLEYLERFLIQSFCAELVYFHRTYKKFRGALSDKERYSIATKIVLEYLTPNSSNELNIKKYEIKEKVINKLKKIEKKKKKTGDVPSIPVDIFDPIHKWVVATIQENSWKKFKTTISSISVYKTNKKTD